MDKHRLSLIVVGVLAVGILLGTFFLGVQPQLERTARADEQRATVEQTNATQKARNSALAADQERIDEYRAGKDKAFNALVGQVMKASKGKANPGQVNALLKAKLG